MIKSLKTQIPHNQYYFIYHESIKIEWFFSKIIFNFVRDKTNNLMSKISPHNRTSNSKRESNSKKIKNILNEVEEAQKRLSELYQKALNNQKQAK